MLSKSLRTNRARIDTRNRTEENGTERNRVRAHIVATLRRLVAADADSLRKAAQQPYVSSLRHIAYWPRGALDALACSCVLSAVSCPAAPQFNTRPAVRITRNYDTATTVSDSACESALRCRTTWFLWIAPCDAMRLWIRCTCLLCVCPVQRSVMFFIAWLKWQTRRQPTKATPTTTFYNLHIYANVHGNCSSTFALCIYIYVCTCALLYRLHASEIYIVRIVHCTRTQLPFVPWCAIVLLHRPIGNATQILLIPLKTIFTPLACTVWWTVKQQSELELLSYRRNFVRQFNNY